MTPTVRATILGVLTLQRAEVERMITTAALCNDLHVIDMIGGTIQAIDAALAVVRGMP
jgi:hypothetical protein